MYIMYLEEFVVKWFIADVPINFGTFFQKWDSWSAVWAVDCNDYLKKNSNIDNYTKHTCSTCISTLKYSVVKNICI